MATTEAVIEHDAEWDELEIGPLLRRLRGRMGLREAHRISGVSASMLSQIESGSRRPGPRTLRKLATFYGVAVRDLLARAGHVDDGERDPDNGPLATGDVERAYQFMLADPRLRTGVRPKEPVSVGAKRFFVHMYERFTGRSLLE